MCVRVTGHSVVLDVGRLQSLASHHAMAAVLVDDVLPPTHSCAYVSGAQCVVEP